MILQRFQLRGLGALAGTIAFEDNKDPTALLDHQSERQTKTHIRSKLPKLVTPNDDKIRKIVEGRKKL